MSSPTAIQPRDFWLEAGRYILAGGIALAADFLTLYALRELVGAPLLVAASMAFMVGLSVVYLLSVRWVYARRTVKDRKLEFAVFAVLSLIGILINDGVIWVTTEKLSQHWAIAKVIATAFIVAWNYSTRKLILFR